MENTNIDARIRAYLAGEMSDRERRAFEDELQGNSALQKAFLQSALWAQPLSANEARVRGIAARYREHSAPLQVPKVTFLDHLRLEPRKMLARAAVLIGILFFAAPAIWVNLVKPLRPVAELPGDFMDPVQLGVAGGPGDTSLTAARAVFERSSDFYWKKRADGLDSLLQVAASCSGFCMAHYYLAHWYLENGQYKQALTEFEACLANGAYLHKFNETEDLDKIKLNKLLAELGASGKSEKVLSGLETLIDETPDESTVHKEAQALHDELTNPLRIFSFR
jgi:hypothetical protein